MKIKENTNFIEDLSAALKNPEDSLEYREYLEQLKRDGELYDVNESKKPEGSISLDGMLLGIYIRIEHSYPLYINLIKNHKKFLGFIKG